MNIIGKETFVMKLMHKTFLNKGECQYDLTIENGQINENVHRGGGFSMLSSPTCQVVAK